MKKNVKQLLADVEVFLHSVKFNSGPDAHNALALKKRLREVTQTLPKDITKILGNTPVKLEFHEMKELSVIEVWEEGFEPQLLGSYHALNFDDAVRQYNENTKIYAKHVTPEDFANHEFYERRKGNWHMGSRFLVDSKEKAQWKK